MIPSRFPLSDMGRNYLPSVTRVTEPARRPMAFLPRVKRRRIVRAYITVVMTIIGLLSAYVALANFIV